MRLDLACSAQGSDSRQQSKSARAAGLAGWRIDVGGAPVLLTAAARPSSKICGHSPATVWKPCTATDKASSASVSTCSGESALNGLPVRPAHPPLRSWTTTHPDGTGALKKRCAVHRQVPRRVEHQGSSGCRGCSNGRNVQPVSRAGTRCSRGQEVAAKPGSDSPSHALVDGPRLRRQRDAPTGTGLGLHPRGAATEDAHRAMGIRPRDVQAPQRSRAPVPTREQSGSKCHHSLCAPDACATCNSVTAQGAELGIFFQVIHS